MDELAEKVVRAFVLIAIGWLIGYLHHFASGSF